MDLAHFIGHVRSLDPAGFGPENLGKLLAAVRLDDHAVRSFVTRPSGYTRTLLYAQPEYEILLLRWSAGARTPIHDHAGQRCWFASIKGAFDLANYRRTSGGRTEGYARIALISTNDGIIAGEPDFRFGEDDIHAVAVSSACDEAVSLHVYAKPLSTCLVFDDAAGRCAVKHLSYDDVLANRITLATA